jgi:hypothetical protein
MDNDDCIRRKTTLCDSRKRPYFYRVTSLDVAGSLAVIYTCCMIIHGHKVPLLKVRPRPSKTRSIHFLFIFSLVSLLSFLLSPSRTLYSSYKSVYNYRNVRPGRCDFGIYSVQKTCHACQENGEPPMGHAVFFVARSVLSTTATCRIAK